MMRHRFVKKAIHVLCLHPGTFDPLKVKLTWNKDFCYRFNLSSYFQQNGPLNQGHSKHCKPNKVVKRLTC